MTLLALTMTNTLGLTRSAGPEDRKSVERRIVFDRESKHVSLVIQHPETDETVDFVVDGHYTVPSPRTWPVSLRWDFRGYFWQGNFGSVRLDVKIKARDTTAGRWGTIDGLLIGLREESIARNLIASASPQQSRQEWLEPYISSLNGVPCIQQYMQLGVDKKAEWLYFFPFDDNFAIELRIVMVDNSKRPGVSASDWRIRADAFAERLLGSIRFATTK